MSERTSLEEFDLFRTLADSMDLVLWARSPETGEIIYVSPPYEKIWGRTRESLYQSDPPFI